MARVTRSLTPPSLEKKKRALWDFWTFVDIISFHGGSKAFGDCHRELVDWWLSNRDVDKHLVLMPRGHLKSTIFTVARTLWRVYQIPDIRIFVGTATRALATAFVREVRTYFEDPFLQEYVWNTRPHVEGRLVPEMERTKYTRGRDDTDATDRKIIWSTSAIQVIRPTILKEPTVTVGSVGTIPTGFHFDEMYLDDVINFDNISTPDKRLRIQNWVDDLVCVLDPKYEDKVWEKILPPKAKPFSEIGGVLTVVGTRYDREDWYGQIVEYGEEYGWKIYQRNIYKNGSDNSDGYLWHEMWTEEIERAKRSQMTTNRFASQYLNMVIAPGSSVLNFDLINFVNAENIQLQDDGRVRITHRTLEGDTLVRPILVVDPAATVGENSDFTALAVGGKDVTGRVCVVDFAMGKWSSEQILSQLFRLANKWKLRGAYIESSGGFAHFVEYVRAAFNRYRPLVLNEYKPTWVQGKKEVRISNALEPLITNGLLYLPQSVYTNTEARDQIVYFPRKTIHDDFPDVLAALAELSKSPQPKPANPLRKHHNKVYGGYR